MMPLGVGLRFVVGLAVAVLLGFPSPSRLAAQAEGFPEAPAGKVAIALEPQRVEVGIGDPVEVRVHARAAKGLALFGDKELGQGAELRAQKRLFGPWTSQREGLGFTIEVAEPRVEVDEAGATHLYARATLRMLRLGSIEVPPLVVRASSGDAAEERATTEALRVEVKAVLDQGEAKSAPEVDPGFIADAPRPPLWPWLVAAAAALALFFVGRSYLRRRRRRSFAAPAAPRVPPDTQAFARIRELERMLERGEIGGERLVVEVSATLRRWLEDGLHQASLAKTTDEFLEDLRANTRFSVVQQNRLQDFLRRCDLIKFAGQEPSQLECKDLLGSVRAFVEETAAPRPGVPASASAGASAALALPFAGIATQTENASRSTQTFFEWQEAQFGFAFADPWFLVLLLALPLLAWRARAPKPALGIASLRLLDGVPTTLRARLRWLPRAMVILALVPLILACARPQTVERVPIESQGIDILLTLDLSSSMAARDLGDASSPDERPTRLDVVKRVAKDFIEKRGGDRIGLIAFARYPDLVCPSTLDHQALLRFLEPLQHKRVPRQFGDQGDPEDGTAIGAALALTSERLRDRKVKSRVAILLSDGNETVNSIDPLEAAKLAADADVRIYAIGAGRAVDVGFGMVQKPDFKTLREIAAKTKGEFYEASSESALAQVFERIDQLERTDLEDPVFAVDERFPLLLLLGFALFVVAALLRVLVFVEVP